MAQSSDGTASRRGPGRPFAPGVSGNPAGRPKAVVEVRDLARAQTSPAVATLVEIMRDGKTDAARVAAAQALLDRGWGKATQVIESGSQPFYVIASGSRPDPADPHQVLLGDGRRVPGGEAAAEYQRARHARSPGLQIRDEAVCRNGPEDVEEVVRLSSPRFGRRVHDA